MRLSDDIHNFITEIVDVLQQFAECYCFVTKTVKISKKIVLLLMRYVK